MVAKDNHVPIIEYPEDQSVFFPTDNSAKLINNLDEWKNKSKDNLAYQPGYPYGTMYPSVKCKN
jgi:urate oxidase